MISEATKSLLWSVLLWAVPELCEGHLEDASVMKMSSADGYLRESGLTVPSIFKFILGLHTQGLYSHHLLVYSELLSIMAFPKQNGGFVLLGELFECACC